MGNLDDVYLPFSEEVLARYLASPAVKGTAVETENNGNLLAIRYYARSAAEYKNFHERRDRTQCSFSEMKGPCQIEKDERIWTAGTLIPIHESAERISAWSRVLQRCFGPTPPFRPPTSWEDLVMDPLELLLEVPLPSPAEYRRWLGQHLRERNLVQYVIDGGSRAFVEESSLDTPVPRLEGFTHADAVLSSRSSGLRVIFEAKLTADASCDVTFDTMRNQLCRIIDAMIDEGAVDTQHQGLMRNAAKSLFVLLTPKLFKDNPQARLYGYLMHDYCSNPQTLARDLPHRYRNDWAEISRRIGWLTWEDCHEILPDACRWIDKAGSSTMLSDRQSQ